MSNSDNKDFYFGISDSKIYICYFETKKNLIKSYVDFEIPDNLNNNLNFKIISNLLKLNIRKLEKELGFFLNKGNVSIKSKTYERILFSIRYMFDEKKLDEKAIANIVQSEVQYFRTLDERLSIIHLVINKYIIDDKVFNYLPTNMKFKKIILEIEFICLSKKLIAKVRNLFKECKIDINKIVSFDYAKKFLESEEDPTMCLSANKIIGGANSLEIRIQKDTPKKKSLFDTIFNFFD